MLERGLHGDLIAVRDDHAAQLGQRPLFRGGEIQRLHVDQRLIDGDREQRTADDLRPSLVPQRELLRNHRVLVDARVDLTRAVDELLLREVEDDQAAVVRRIGARRQPRDHVVAPRRVEEGQEHELLTRLARDAHDRVVRLHITVPSLDRPTRHRPQILLVVEHLRIEHVVRRVLACLDGEEIFRIPDVTLQVLGHLGERLHETRERRGPRTNERVGGIRHVEDDVTVVRVHRRLDRVADVVADARHRVRVRIAIGRRVAVQHPHQPSIRCHHHVRIPVVAEERRDLAHPLRHRAKHHDPALVGQVVREQDLDLREARGEGELAEPRAQHDAAAAPVRRVHVLIAGRIVELLRACPHERVLVGDLTVVDLGPRDLRESARRGGRNVLDQELRQSLRGDAVDGAHDHAVTMGERQMLIDPDAGLQVRIRQLARRDHELTVLAVDHVAVVVDVLELVVGPDLLELRERPQQRPVVPQPDVLDRGRVPLERSRVE